MARRLDRPSRDRYAKDSRLAELWRSSVGADLPLARFPAQSGNSIVCFKCTGDIITTQHEDDEDPELIGPVIVGGTGKLCLVFSKTLDPTTAQNIANYGVDGGATITSATLSSNGLCVTLTVDGMLSGSRNLTITGVKDTATPPNTIVPTTAPFVSDSTDPTIDCPCPEGVLSEEGFYPGEFCYRDPLAISQLHGYPADATVNVYCLGVPLNPDEELVKGRYYIGFIAGDRNGKAVCVVIALEGAELGTATSTSTSTSTSSIHPEPPVGCGCGQGCTWIASLHTDTDCLELTVQSATGQFSALDLTQVINWHWGSTSSPDLFNWTGGSAAVRMTLTGGTPHLFLGDAELTFLCCGDGFVLFAGGPGNGLSGSGFSPDTSCQPDYFCVKVACACCPIEGWGGPGWYCIATIGTATGSGNCVAVELLTEDSCDINIVICSGPYVNEAGALAVCGPPPFVTYTPNANNCLFGGLPCCPDFEINQTICVFFHDGTGGGAHFNGAIAEVTYNSGLTSLLPCTLVFNVCLTIPADPVVYDIQVSVQCSGVSPFATTYGVGLQAYLASCLPGNIIVGSSAIGSNSVTGCIIPGGRPWDWTTTMAVSAGLGGGTVQATVIERYC